MLVNHKKLESLRILLQPNVDTSNSEKTQGDQRDSHFLTHHQKVQQGLESEEVGTNLIRLQH